MSPVLPTNAIYLRSAELSPPPPPPAEEPDEDAPKEEGHWSDYWFEEPAADVEEPPAPETAPSPPPPSNRNAYPFTLPAVKALSDIHFGQVTILVGDNGSGKSTLVEALAVAADFNPEGGSRNLRFETNATHSSLADELRLAWNRRPRWGWFFRAETFYGMATYIEQDNDPQGGVASMFPNLHDRSHGESFLTLIESRLEGDGLYFLDEVESALSFHGQLRLLHIMHEACRKGAQFIIATHSPLLMAFPGAKVYELSDSGATRVKYDDIDAVQLWRHFLKNPDRMLEQLFESD